MSLKRTPEVLSTISSIMWGGELWNDGYFVRSVGDKVTAEVIGR